MYRGIDRKDNKAVFCSEGLWGHGNCLSMVIVDRLQYRYISDLALQKQHSVLSCICLYKGIQQRDVSGLAIIEKPLICHCLMPVTLRKPQILDTLLNVGQIKLTILRHDVVRMSLRLEIVTLATMNCRKTQSRVMVYSQTKTWI